MATSTPAGPGDEPEEDSAGEGSAELDEDVLEMVRRQLERDPPPSTTALYGRAARINRDIYRLSLRQFHAKYPLRVKREQARRERRRTAASSGPDSGAGGADGGAEDSGPAARNGTGEAADAAADEDAGRRHLFGADDDPDGGEEDPRRSGTAPGDGGSPGPGHGPADAETRTRRPADEHTRERVRRVLMRFAREVAEAEGPEMLVGVAERLPDRVDEIARIVRGRPPAT